MLHVTCYNKTIQDTIIDLYLTRWFLQSFPSILPLEFFQCDTAWKKKKTVRICKTAHILRSSWVVSGSSYHITVKAICFSLELLFRCLKEVHLEVYSVMLPGLPIQFQILALKLFGNCENICGCCLYLKFSLQTKCIQVFSPIFYVLNIPRGIKSTHTIIGGPTPLSKKRVSEQLLFLLLHSLISHRITSWLLCFYILGKDFWCKNKMQENIQIISENP